MEGRGDVAERGVRQRVLEGWDSYVRGQRLYTRRVMGNKDRQSRAEASRYDTQRNVENRPNYESLAHNMTFKSNKMSLH